MAADTPDKQKDEEAEEIRYNKHLLQNRWTLWFYKPETGKVWEDRQVEVATFGTVEDFWSLYNHIELASKLKLGCDYSLFKEGIKPMWEDDQNKSGGRWLINLNRQQRLTDLDNFWLELLLVMIGDAFDDHSEEVCGAVVNIRAKGDKIAIWTRNGNKAGSVLKIGSIIKERLMIPRNLTIGFQLHSDSIVKSGSTAKNKYVA